MSSKHSSRTARRLLKLASLGLAGLLAGLLSGCSASPKAVSANPYANTESAEQFTPPTSTLPTSLDATSIPALRHPPSTRRLPSSSVPPSTSLHGS